jgi:hypothetical protein
MDATHSEFTTNNYLYMYRSAFDKQHHGALRKAFGNHSNRVVSLPSASGARPRKFNSGNMNLSGKADTTLNNDWPNAFVDFCAHRRAGKDAMEAFSAIGPKFGDDGLGDGSVERVSIATALGLTLKSDVVPSDQPLSFLSRIFVAPRHTPTSICEPVRALAKIPVLSAKVGDQDLANKVAGYLSADPNAPLISQYLRALTRVYKLPAAKEEHTGENAYKASLGAYNYDQAFEGECLAAIASRLGLGIHDVQVAIRRIDEAQTVKDLTAIRLMDAVRPHNDVIAVNDHVVALP